MGTPVSFIPKFYEAYTFVVLLWKIYIPNLLIQIDLMMDLLGILRSGNLLVFLVQWWITSREIWAPTAGLSLG